MSNSTEILNQRIQNMSVVPTPIELIHNIPQTSQQTQTVLSSRQQIESVLCNKSNKLVVIVGPCSIHNYESAMDYARFLQTMKPRVSDHLEIVMRTYFAKPRTTVGWKGYIYDPELNGSCDVHKGLHKSRQLLHDILDCGIPCAMEHLDTITPQYFGDALSWAAIGARTTESQVHRELASGVSTPIGFKNGTGGSIELAANAVKASSQPHRFFGCNDKGQITTIETTGNPYCHIILRGSSQGPNYDWYHVNKAKACLQSKQLPENIFIDMSHGNSQKNHTRQLDVCDAVSHQMKNGCFAIKGVMIESNIVEGNQSIDNQPLTYGQSITDACVGLKDTETMLLQLYNAVKYRNARVDYSNGDETSSMCIV